MGLCGISPRSPVRLLEVTPGKGVEENCTGEEGLVALDLFICE